MSSAKGLDADRGGDDAGLASLVARGDDLDGLPSVSLLAGNRPLAFGCFFAIVRSIGLLYDAVLRMLFEGERLSAEEGIETLILSPCAKSIASISSCGDTATLVFPLLFTLTTLALARTMV